MGGYSTSVRSEVSVQVEKVVKWVLLALKGSERVCCLCWGVKQVHITCVQSQFYVSSQKHQCASHIPWISEKE